MKHVDIVGLGPGGKQCITQEVKDTIENAEIIIGSKRLTEPYSDTGRKVFCAVTADAIMDIVKNEDAQKFVVLMSGDTGFYSGTKKLVSCLISGNYSYRILPGISSIVYLASRIGQPWETAALVSLHGKKQSYIPVVMQNEWTYFLTGGNVAQICQKIEKIGLADAKVWIGENLSYDNENIVCGKISEFTDYDAAGLTVMAVNNENPQSLVITGIPDDKFIRGDVPMTKREIRASVVSRMSAAKDACIYDIGAGTGSVTVELALHALYGIVYAVERTPEGCELIAKNVEHFGLDNIEIINGNAAEVIDDLPAPDAVFIGGSGGELECILEKVLKKNPDVHIVITAVTLETLEQAVSLMEKNNMCADIVQIAVTEVKKRGKYHMMAANNPVFLIDGRKQFEESHQ